LFKWGREVMALQPAPERQAEAYRFRIPELILAPLLALVLQAYLPLYFPLATLLNLPLLVVIYFALARRSPVVGIIAGALIGIAQDSLSRDPIGLFAITNTCIGYVTSSVSSRMDSDNPGVRLISIFLLSYLYAICVYLFSFALGDAIELVPGRTLAGALVNAVAGVLLFQLLDRFRKPA
jgi:rod shape-determining protein MreD